MTDFDKFGGVGIMGFVSPMNTDDTYAVIDPKYGIDGLRNVDTIEELNLIPIERRRAGMIVGVIEEDIYFKLKNIDWNYDLNDWSELYLINKIDKTADFQFVDKEVPSGVTDGVNQNFLLSHTPVDGSEHVFLNGLLQESEYDYIVNGNEIFFIIPPLTDMRIKCTYRY